VTLAPLKAGVRTPYGEARSTVTIIETGTRSYRVAHTQQHQALHADDRE
jgi:hypothetical protein